MNYEDEAKVAWIIWNLLHAFNDLLWDRYEGRFINFYTEEEDQNFQECHIESDVPF